MPLQTHTLSMAALSVLHDVPPNTIQPKLADGIHLRWAFERERGFPWFGYYLYRRQSNSADRVIRSADLAGLPLGSGAATSLGGPQGTLSSDQPLFGTDDFAPAGTPEADLAGRAYLRYVPSDIASEVRVSIGFRQDAEVAITAFLQQVPVTTAHVKGKAGSIETIALKFDSITSVDVGPGPAAVVDIGFLAVTDNPLAGWQPTPGFPKAGTAVPYPLCLPVAHPDYTCPSAPADVADAEALALARVHYVLPPAWESNTFANLHATLQALVDGGPSGPTMAEKASIVVPVPPDPGLTMPRQAPLDLLLLGGLHTGIAQMLGLAWVDADAAATPDSAYDYLIVADYKGVLGGEWQLGLDYLRTHGFGDVDAYIASDKKVNDPSPALAPPADARVYALPGGTSTTALIAPADANAAGLRWDRGVTSLGVLLPGRPVLYHVWRAGLGSGATPTAPGAYQHRTTEGPVVVVDAESGSAQANPPQDWPPVRLYFVDGGLPDGWYGYQSSGVDLFGRHSANSAAAPWYQWTPAPVPLPWYYTQPASNSVVHPSAVGLLDKVGPPPPTGIEAWVLDPDDPLLVEDAPYAAWRAALPTNERSVVGLRVSWLWPQSHMEQAPDTREFRIYVHGGRRNTLVGNTTAVTAASATESTVDTDIANARAANAYVGTRLQIGDSSFRVVGSDAATLLRLRVANIGPGDKVRPAANAPCSIAIPETTGTGATQQPHPLYVNFATPTSWDERYYVVPVGSSTSDDVVVFVDGAGKDLTGAAATASGTEVALDGSPALAGAGIVGSYLRLDNDTARTDKLYRITLVNAATGMVRLDGVPNLPPAAVSPWVIGRKQRRYELFLPAPGDAYRGGSPLTVNTDDPLAYGSVSVSAADDKTHTTDAAKWAPPPTSRRWGGASRYGNEGRVGASATIFQVYRGKPQAPDLPTYADDRLLTSRADYHSRSFFTFRWVALAGAKTHVLRALDDTLFSTDWLIRSTRTALSGSDAAHAKFFPPAWSLPAVDLARKNAAAAQLNAITSLGAYAALLPDARLLLARLPGNEGFVWGEGLAERDWEIRRTRTALAAGDAALFPADWSAAGAANQQKRQDAATALNGIASLAAYIMLSNNALRVLASLPGNEAAYSQLTILPLDPGDPAATDVRGPDSPETYAPVATLRAYGDSIDGRSINRYFYRALNVNAVQTRGDLSLSTPPVYCPDVMPPRAVVVTKALGGDREITLYWASNRETDLAFYRVYRSEDAERARDVRLMTQVQPIAVSAAPSARPGEVVWTDKPVPGLTMLYYRIVAEDADGNASIASPVVAARAYDDSRPDPPTWGTTQQTAAGLELNFTLSDPSHRPLVQRRDEAIYPRMWVSLSPWLTGGVQKWTDAAREPGNSYVYRIRVQDVAGRTNRTFNEITV